MNIANRWTSLVTLAALIGCGDQGPVTSQIDPSLSASGRGAVSIGVMTRNLYIGADVDAVMGALVSPDQSDDLPALMVALQTIQRTDYATRARAIAAEIHKNRPAVVGLQEVYDLTVIPEWLGLPGDPIQIDFLAGLEAALAAEGLNYVVAARNTTTDATLAGGAVRIIDHDVLLADANRVTLQGPAVATVFTWNIGFITDGITLLRGYVARRATIDGIEVLLVNTHLESGADPQIAGLRYYQAMELAGFIGTAPRVILTGDLNGERGSDMYTVLASAGLTDMWAAKHPGAQGLTCCNLADLSNASSTPDQRIDFIWTRGFEGPSGQVQGQVSLVSAQPSARVIGVLGLIWPSDHAGLAADLLLPPSVLR